MKYVFTYIKIVDYNINMNIQITLDYVGYDMKYDPDYSYDYLYMFLLSAILKYFLYNEIDLDEGYIIEENNKYYVLACIGDNSNFNIDRLKKNYKKLDSRLKRYFKIDFNDCIYSESKDRFLPYDSVYLKIEFTGVNNRDDMIYLDTIRKLLEKN